MEEKIKILILEDLPSDAELAEREIKAVLNNYKIVVADTEQGFIEALENFKPDLIISDYKLPTFDGMKALQITRKKEEYIPFIILTGSMNEETAVECMKAGADDYVIKEHISRLGPAVLNALDKKKIRQERKQAEEALKESEEKYRKIFENVQDIFYQVDNEGNIIDISPSVKRYSGYSREELIGTPVTRTYYNSDDLDLLKAELEKKGEVVDYEIRLKTKREKFIYGSLNAHILYDKNKKPAGIEGSLRDITERKLAVEALRESEMKFRNLSESTRMGIALYQNDYWIYANPAAEEISGYSIDELKHMKFWEFVAPEYVDLIKERGKARQKGTPAPSGYEFKIITKQGKEKWVFLTGNTTELKSGKAGLISVIDITERKLAEKELTKLSTAVKQSPSIIIITDTDGNLEYVNPKFTEITGYSLEEAIEQNPCVLKSGEQSDEMYKELWETITSGKVWRGEFHNKKKNGELFWEMALVSPIFDEQGKIINYIKVAEDITGQKRNEQIHSIIHNISNAVITSHSLKKFLTLVKDELGKLIDTTNFFVAIYDEETDSVSLPLVYDEKDRVEALKTYSLGKTLTHYVIKTEKPLLAKKAMIEKLIKSGEVEQVGHLSEVWLGVPLKSENKITGIFAVQSYNNENAYDEADVKMLEIISYQISLSIERLKAEEELKLAKEKAEESDRLKTAFLNNMSHEIRTPLNGITGFIELLKNTEIDDEERQLYFDMINKSSDRLIATVTDIIDISRIEAGEVKVSKSEVSVNEILEEQYNFFYHEAKSKGLELIYKPSLTDSESRIITDKLKLEGILTNLIKNAIKFTDQGEINFGCSLKKEQDFEFLEFYVKDTGIGIPENRIDAIFNRFEQADIADTRAFQGSGLGLAITKSYVEMLGGKISVKSKEGEGSTFTFSIPYTKPFEKESSVKEKINKEPQTSLSHLSLIIAEDDETSKLLYETIFKNKVKKVTYTSTGKETIEKLRENPDTDIILMDIKMSDMDGYDATKEIRKFNSDVVIIAQTAFGLSGDREKALEAGCDDYIAKPIQKQLLFEKIRACLDKKSN